ncbi:hypothetical protein Tco_1149677 [Tanacetum coccineum]
MVRLVKHGLKECGFESESQLDHEIVDRFVVVVVKVVLVVGIGRIGDVMKVDDDFGMDVFLFQTCLTDILGFLEKLELLFEQDIDVEEGR